MTRERKSARAQKPAAALAQLLRGEPDSSLAALLGHYYHRAPPEDLAAADRGDLRGAVIAHRNFAKVRAAGEALCRIYNPQRERDGWRSAGTVLEIVTDNMPFLVDSVSIALNRHGLTIHLTIHPVVHVARDSGGNLLDATAAPDSAKNTRAESWMRFQVDRQPDDGAMRRLQDEIKTILSEIRRACDDWKPMLGKVSDAIAALGSEAPAAGADAADLGEAADFCRWIADNNFTFLGYCEYENAGGGSRINPRSALGVLRTLDEESCNAVLPADSENFMRPGEPLMVTKASAQSRIHRPAYMDCISILRRDSGGRPRGRLCILGLFTSTLYRQPTRSIPLLRLRGSKILQRSGFAVDGHGGKALQDVLDSFPRDSLFQIPEEELFEICMGILELQERQRIRLFMHRDVHRRFYFCMIYLPRDRYTRELRLRFQDILMDALHGTGFEFGTLFSESMLARIHFIIHAPTDSEARISAAEIQRRIMESTRSWGDRLREALAAAEPRRAARLFKKYAAAFPAGYQEDFTAADAVRDIAEMERMGGRRQLGIRLAAGGDGEGEGGSGGELRLKLFSREKPVPPSDTLPILEAMGLRAVAVRTYLAHPADAAALWVHEFALAPGGGGELRVNVEHGDNITESFLRTWEGLAENDGFNRMVLSAGLHWREVSVLRAICKYLRQIRIRYSENYMIETLGGNPRMARRLVRLFHARFDPAGDGAADDALVTEINEGLERVANLDEDRILRAFLNVIESTLRTNFYQKDAGGGAKPYLSFKLDPQKILRMPEPKPMFEIFVYSPRVEAVHLRGGRIARGGLRWSDRREDFRTEVLGLVKAQMVKNAVIVPTGSKGGFVVKRLPEDGGREKLMAEVVECYKTFIRGMLDLTDNLVDGAVAAPADVVRHDEDDPYLVIAADKGTAAFSDTANEVAAEYGFWLDDGFASGGSTGYDHKKMGITAKGAWESVKHHFRELGVDTQSMNFTAIGIGDMGGDVFGNGMLLSKRLKLVGAFNHQHIFLDPDPDPETSFNERRRLFNLPRSGWSDYDPGLISAGGGVFARSAKSIALSAEAREALKINALQLTPNELINAMLKAPVDLLWNGGIGTYVKAAAETDEMISDRANDGVRVCGRELRCRVVGEGGNLGLTQLGRIEYSRHGGGPQGGRCYSDFIDNSGGVDASDHEINIKILLNAAVAAGKLTVDQRNALLAHMTDTVGGLVLADNYAQSRALGFAARNAPHTIGGDVRMIRRLERGGQLDRALEFLPGDDDLRQRRVAGQGLTRPELAVLLAYGKIVLYNELVRSDLPEDPFLHRLLVDYFPPLLGERHRDDMGRHQLRREIIATAITNDMLNTMGPTFAERMKELGGADSADMTRAYIAAAEIFSMDETRREIEALDNKVASGIQYEMTEYAVGLIERAASWILRNRRMPLDISATVGHFKPGVAELSGSLARLLAAPNRLAQTRRARQLLRRGVPEALANKVAGFIALSSALDIVEVAAETGRGVLATAQVYFTLGAQLELQWLRDMAAHLETANHWHTLARFGLHNNLRQEQRLLAAAVLNESGGAKPRAMVKAWLARHHAPRERFLQVMEELQTTGNPDYAMLSVAVNELKKMRSDAGVG